MKITMDHEFTVETILVQNRDDDLGIKERMNPSKVTVGSLDNISANDICEAPIIDSAVLECGGLKGKIIGITQDRPEENQNIFEVRAYPWKNIASTATTENEVGCSSSDCTRFGAENALA